MVVLTDKQNICVTTGGRGKYCQTQKTVFFVNFVTTGKHSSHEAFSNINLRKSVFLISVLTVLQLFTPTNLKPLWQFVSGTDGLPRRRENSKDWNE